MALTSLCIETGLVLEIKNPSKTAGYVCFVTHSPIIAKPLVLGMTLQWGVKYTLMEGVRGAQLALAAPSQEGGRAKTKGKKWVCVEASRPLIQMAPTSARRCWQLWVWREAKLQSGSNSM